MGETNDVAWSRDAEQFPCSICPAFDIRAWVEFNNMRAAPQPAQSLALTRHVSGYSPHLLTLLAPNGAFVILTGHTRWRGLEAAQLPSDLPIALKKGAQEQ
jgi:hypothetical protein